MENRAYALAAGVFVLVVGALLVAAVLWLSRSTHNGVPYDLITRRSVAGLTPGALVRLHGVEVGQVESIRFDPLDRRQVLVRARISPDALLMQGSWAHLSSLGISGTPYIELGFPEGAAIALETSEDAPARIPLAPAGLAQLSDASDALLQAVSNTLARIDGVLTPENQAQVTRLLREGSEAAARIRILSEELRPVAQRTARLAARAEAAVATAQRTMQDADLLLAQARAHDGALDALQGGAQGLRLLTDRLLDDTLPDITELSGRLQRNSDTLEELLSEVRDRPQSVLFGAAPATPGPGEPGFRAPRQ
jgi:phospholipid/cholesterol/gamma-HCH transport system substrate-binding protein